MNQESLLSEMNGKTITCGWDVVCAMSANHISQLFKDKYDQGETSGLLYRLTGDAPVGRLEIVSFDFQIGPPEISFIEKDPTRCNLRLEIKEGLAEDKEKSTGEVLDSQKIPSGPDDKNHYYINAVIPLSVIKGKVENSHDVIINFDETESVHIDLNFDDTIIDYVTSALKTYFRNNLDKTNWSLGTLIYKENPELIHLTPTSFEFATSVLPGDPTDTGCLLLFITTKDGNKGTTNELIGRSGRIFTPYPDDHSAALIISSRLFFERVLLSQFQQHISSNVAAKSDPVNSSAYKLQGSGSIGCGRFDNDQKQDINVPIDNFQVGSDNNSALCISWNQTWNNKVQYWHTVCDPTHYCWDELSDGEVTLGISINNPVYSFSVLEPEQAIYCNSSVKVQVSGDQPSWWDGYGFSHAKEFAKGRVEGKMGGILSFQLKGIDIFAVSNLLFPADHIISYDKNGVYVPGDLVIFGKTKSKL